MNKYFHGLLLGVSVLPALLVMPAMAERLELTSGQSADETDAVYSDYTSSYGYGGGIDNYGGTFTETNVTVQNNTAAYLGGGINNDGEGTIIDGLIGGNTTELGNHAGGGAGIANSGTLTITGTTVQNNNATNYGGGVFNGISSLGNGVLTISNSTIKDNIAKNIGGGIFSMGGASALTGSVSITNVNFFNNSTQESVKDTAYGGAFALLDAGDATIKGSVFGGYDTTDSEHPISLGNTSGKGGAVYIGGVTGSTHGESNVTITKDESNNKTVFDHNVANGTGGAGYGGALVHNGYKTFLDLSDAEFTYNSATNQAGALIVTTIAGTERADGLAATINNVLFANNTAGSQGGAVWIGSKANITNTEFRENSTTGAIEGGGAIDLGSDSMTTFNNVTFADNESSTDGGAMATRHFSNGANDSATLDITSATFTHNTATTNGGAINNYFYHSTTDGHADAVYIANSTFAENGAATGGAVYNHISQAGDANQGQIGNIYFVNSTFSGNNATTAGGAIYNEGNITLAGTNTFTGNTANGLANDIHNVGSLTVASGTTTMDGGITGDGTLSIANGATLNVGTSTIEQGTVTLDGTMLATLRDGGAQITAGTFDGNGTLKLSFAGEGTYHVFGDAAFRAAGIEATSSVYDITWAENNKDMVVSIKSAADIAEQNDIEQDAAKAIVGLNASTSEKLNDLGIKIQEKLAEGTPEAKREVEHAAKAVHPEKESVTQSVVTSVQNTVTNLASARMAAPTFGRSGGDITMTSGGVWAQGLLNKSKQNDAFRGYTRGISAGLDGTMNRVWTVGAGYSYAHSDISGSARQTEIDSNTVFLYGQYKPAAWYVNAVANYTMSDYSEEGDAMGTPVTADYDVDALGMAVAAGYDLDFGLTPELGLRYMHVMADDYTNSLGVKTKSDNTNFLTGVLGAKYAFNVVADKYTTFVPQLNAAIKYDMLSDKNVATITMPGVDAYTLDVERLSRFGGEFGIGLGMKHRGMDFSINYDIDVRKDYTSQTGMLKFRYNF